MGEGHNRATEESRLRRDAPGVVLFAASVDIAEPVCVAVFVRTALVEELMTSALRATGLVPWSPGTPDSLGAAASPDVVVVSADGGGGDLIPLLAEARRRLPAKPLVVVGADDRQAFIAAMAGGATEYVTFDATIDTLAARLRAVVTGRLADTRLLHSVLAGTDPRSGRPRRRAVDRLTTRERDVLLLVTRGLTTDDIAETLGIGLPTVRSHVHRILKKLNVRTRVQAAAVAARRGMR